MAKVQYVEKRLRQGTLDILETANDIIENMQAQGFVLTLRQLYYQFIAADLFPESWIDPVYNAREGLDPDTKNTEKSYKRLGGMLTDGRLVGIIDWEAIEDRTRSDTSRTHWESTSAILHAAANGYTIDQWEGQDTVPEVWIEKEALAGVFEPTCRKHDVLLFPCRGYPSISAMWEAAMRIGSRFEETGQSTTILHFGDHDPSGCNMSRDIYDRLGVFIDPDAYKVDRIALNMGQIRSNNLPTNPAKVTDSRAKKYIQQYGRVSWELDALDAPTLAALVTQEVEALKDDADAFQQRIEVEIDGQAALREVAVKWGKKNAKK